MLIIKKEDERFPQDLGLNFTIFFRFLDGFHDFWQFLGIPKWLIHENFHVSISMYKWQNYN
jgi:hypothetical protein